jgi:UDP-glucose 4-epimerase
MNVGAADRSRRVLVTGGSGFIGSHVVDALLREGHVPRIFDLRPSPFHSGGGVEVVLGDLTDQPALARAMKGCDAVVHLAAAADVAEVAADPVEAERRNSCGTLHVLEAARVAKIARVVYASTVWVYSDVVADEVDEDTPLRHPGHLYTATKLAGELYCRSYQELYGVEYTVLRFGIPYGPRARPAAVIPRFVEKALAGEPLTLAGDGRQTRAFVYVEDLAEGVIRSLAPAAANRTYNLATREEVTIAEIAEAVQELVAPVGIERAPDRNGDFKGAVICSRRAEEELGWTASTPFREGLSRYVDWHVAASVPEVIPAVRRRFPVGAVSALLTSIWVLIALAAMSMLDADGDATEPLLWALVLLGPAVLMVAGARVARPACWGLAGAELAVAILPWPGGLGDVGHGHQMLLLLGTLLAIAAAAAARHGDVLRPAAERS